MNDIEKAFRGLGRTKKVEFISEKIDYASAHAVQGMCQVIFLMC